MRRVLILIVITLILIPAAIAGPHHRGNRAGGCDLSTIVAELPYAVPDDTESAALRYMREEEKLARDIYRAMDDLWGLRVFRNIAGAEQFHMDAMLALLDKYGLEDPAAGAADGEFNDPTLQALNNQLVQQGSGSLLAALEVGATIEDLDIRDLQVDLEQTDNEDIRTVFQNLMKGSRNHLRSFVSLLASNGVEYAPSYISQADFDEIISTPKERGMLDSVGAPGAEPDCPRASGTGRRGRSSRR